MFILFCMIVLCSIYNYKDSISAYWWGKGWGEGGGMIPFKLNLLQVAGACQDPTQYL